MPGTDTSDWSQTGGGVPVGYVGQGSITTLGTIGTGVWQGTAVAIAYGGTGATDAATARANLGVTGKYETDVGDTTSTTLTVTHNLGTRGVQVTVFPNSGLYDDVIVNVHRPTINTVDLLFAVAPGTNAYHCVVMG